MHHEQLDAVSWRVRIWVAIVQSSARGAASIPSPAMSWSRDPGVVSDVIEGKAVLVDAAGRELITLNAVGTIVWEALDGRRDLAGLCDAVAARYPSTSRAQVETDVRSFLAELSRLGLVKEPAPESD